MKQGISIIVGDMFTGDVCSIIKQHVEDGFILLLYVKGIS